MDQISQRPGQRKHSSIVHQKRLNQSIINKKKHGADKTAMYLHIQLWHIYFFIKIKITDIFSVLSYFVIFMP